MPQSPTFSVILPFYKQAEHMQSVVDDFKAAMSAFGHPYEIIIVVNGARDAASDTSERILSDSPRVVEGVLRTAGWGLALRWGFEHSKGKYVCYTNSARTTGAEVVRLLRYALLSESAIVKSCRPERNRLRKWVSIAFNMLNRIVLGTPSWDVNAAPKIIPRKVLDAVSLTSRNELMDAELLYKAFKKHIPVIEVPILQWNRKSGPSTTNWITAVKLFFGVFKLWWTVR